MVDYTPINGFTKKRVLDTLRSIERKSYSSGRGDWSACSYLLADGRRCAVGVFIDPEYWEGKVIYDGTVGGLLEDHPELASKMPFELEALRALQDKHDKYPDNECPEIGEYLASWLEEQMNKQGV